MLRRLWYADVFTSHHIKGKRGNAIAIAIAIAIASHSISFYFYFLNHMIYVITVIMYYATLPLHCHYTTTTLPLHCHYTDCISPTIISDSFFLLFPPPPPPPLPLPHPPTGMETKKNLLHHSFIHSSFIVHHTLNIHIHP
jgi:hypothetical protein